MAKALNIHVLHQPRDRASGDIEALAAQLAPDLANAIDAPVVLEDASDLGLQVFIPTRTIRPPRRIGPLRQMIVVCQSAPNADPSSASNFDP
jgi:hypothetical protein